MVCTRKKRQSDGKLLRQLVDFDQDFIIGNTVCDKQENATANQGVATATTRNIPLVLRQ